MALRLEKALKKGVEAHRDGQVKEAEEFYTVILKAQPKHPDANHNMGVLAVGVGKTEDALPFFKTALEANPRIGQFWLSYADALIKLNRIADAKAVFIQAKGKGAKGEVFDQLEQRLSELSVNSQDPPSHQLQPIVNLYTQGQLQQTLSKVSEMLERFPNSVVLYNIAGASNAGLMQFDTAIDNYKQALSIKPDYAEAYYNMGNALNGKGEPKAAIVSYKKALSIKPDYAEAHYNLGVALYGEGDLETAIDNYNIAVLIKPDYAEAYNNMGAAQKDKGDLEAALGSYKQALLIKPDYFEAYNNMGVALREKGDSEAAIDRYKQALLIKPNYAEAYFNMAGVLNDKGDLEAAIDSFKKALQIEPNRVGAWNSLEYLLQAKKLKVTAVEELLSTFNSLGDSKYVQIARSVLNYKLHIGGVGAEHSLNEACCLLSTADNTNIKNPEATNNIPIHKIIGPDKIVALVHFGRSGTGLLHSLIDGHPKVSTMPSIYFSEFFNHSNWEKIISGGWNEMADQFIGIYEVLFDASVRNSVNGQGKGFEYLGQREGMANVGLCRDEALRLDKELFRKELNHLISLHDDLNASAFFKLVHLAYNKSLNDEDNKHLIFYHIHNPNTHAKLNFVHVEPNANWVIMVREPLQACESWVRDHFNDHHQISARIVTMLFEPDNIIYQKQDSIAVRLEDLKEFPRKTIPALCDWMGIEETESLYEMTAQGKKWWGDPVSPDYKKDGMEPFGKISIRRKVGAIFTENDQFILHTLFYPFSVRFGYTVENLEQFKADLEVIRPMLDEMFGFEKTMAERAQLGAEQFMKSGSYLYLRSSLIQRWNVLARFHTYPNMIKPLKINQ